MILFKNAGAVKKSEKPSLAEVMKKGREEKKRQEDMGDTQETGRGNREGAHGNQGASREDIHTEDSETDEEEYNMMIAGLSEVVGAMFHDRKKNHLI